MRWIFLGYTLTVCAALAAMETTELKMYPDLESIAGLLFLPSVVTVLGAKLFAQKTAAMREAVRAAIEHGLMRPWHALQIGVFTGMICVSMLAALSLMTMLGTTPRIMLGTACGLVLLGAPACACGCLAFYAKNALATSRGFPVLQTDEHQKQEP